MRNYRLLSILFLIVFFSGALFNAVCRFSSNDVKKELETLRLVFPQAEKFSSKFTSPAHYKAYKTGSQTGKDELAGVAFVTTDVTPQIRGYAGPIKIMVGVNTDGKINAVHILSHSETPTYVIGLQDFMAQFSHLGIKDTFRLGKDLDGITRATVTSEAVTRSIEKGLKIIGRDVLNLDVSEEKAAPKMNVAVDQLVIPLILFGVAMGGIFLRRKALRWTALLGGLLYLGLIKSTMVSAIQVANIGLGKLPVFKNNPLWYLLVGLTILSGILAGMVYCGSVCPFATVQELLFNLFQKLKLKALKFSPKTDAAARYIKYAVLLIVLAASFIIGNAGAANVEPFLIFFTGHATALGAIFVALILVVSAFHFRFWCKYLCPVGAACGLLSRISIFKIKLGDDCGGCQICEDICPTEAIRMDNANRPVIDYPECILCGRCIDICPKGTLQFKGKKYETK